MRYFSRKVSDFFLDQKLIFHASDFQVNVREMNFERDENREPKAYPRGNALQSIRQQTTKGEKNAEKRVEKKKRKERQEKQVKEDLARRKNMKLAELAEKMENLKQTIGVSDMDIDPMLLKGTELEIS